MATPYSSSDDDGDHTDLIIGTVIGGTIFLCLLIGLCFYCCGGYNKENSANGREDANGKGKGKHEMVQKSDHEMVESGKQQQQTVVVASAPPTASQI